MSEYFHRIARTASRIVGSPWTFLLALLIVATWGMLGPIFHFSDTWQLVINTSTTIITFLVVFLIQNTQNRDSEAVHLKLDELIRAQRGASNALVDLEDMNGEELEKLHERFEQVRHKASMRLASHETKLPPSSRTTPPEPTSS
jgi:low affinity Fe/Cu permease